MTALSDYERLEASGLFSPGPGAQRRDVIVSLGHASLTITDQKDTALAHWSLAAIERRDAGVVPAIYVPDANAEETLEIADADMVEAIERIRRVVDGGRPKPGRLRRRGLWLFAVLVAIVAAVWLPDALTRTTARIAPDAVRNEIGAGLVDRMVRVAGRACTTEPGHSALDSLVSALSPQGPKSAVIFSGAAFKARHVPGGVVLLNRSVVEDYETPYVAAGFLLAEADRAAAVDPLLPLLQHAGLSATLRLATTGHLPARALDGWAEKLAGPAERAHVVETLARRFDAAQVPLSPYAYALDVTGETTLPLIEADLVRPDSGTELLRDEDWVALQGICGG